MVNSVHASIQIQYYTRWCLALERYNHLKVYVKMLELQYYVTVRWQVNEILIKSSLCSLQSAVNSTTLCNSNLKCLSHAVFLRQPYLALGECLQPVFCFEVEHDPIASSAWLDVIICCSSYLLECSMLWLRAIFCLIKSGVCATVVDFVTCGSTEFSSIYIVLFAVFQTLPWTKPYYELSVHQHCDFGLSHSKFIQLRRSI